MRIQHSVEIAFGPYGGAELFFADIDNDGQVEILTYQGPGVYGAAMYRTLPEIAVAYPKFTCLSAFKQDGKRLWTFGEPNPSDQPYICHAHESCVATADVDGDGVVEVALADGDRIVLLDGPTGKLRAQVTMPHDNFFIIQTLGEPPKSGEAALVVKNGEGGYDEWRYGEPIIGFQKNLDIAWGPIAIPGGHHILTFDVDNDGRKEYLIGYCAVKPSGDWRCIVRAVDPKKVDAHKSHVDYTDILHLAHGEFVLGFAGSDKAYLVMSNGRTLFSKRDKHVQGCALGKFRSDSDYQLAIYNDDGPMVLYDPDGNELWRVSTSDKEQWPLGMPQACERRVFHRNRPIMKLSGCVDRILFTDGGWPWVMTGDGNVEIIFEPPANSKQPEMSLPERIRADDMGYGFATKIVDWHGDGKPQAVIYDRRHLWVFECQCPVI